MSASSTASTAAVTIEVGAALPRLPSPAAEVRRFWAVAAFGALLVLVGLGAAHTWKNRATRSPA